MQIRPVLQSLAATLGLILGTNSAPAGPPPSPEVPTLQAPHAVIQVDLGSGQSSQPLLRAVASGNQAEVSRRLADGDHVDAVLAGVAGQPGVCAAGIAAAAGDIPMLDLLLQAGAAIDGPSGAQSPLAEAALACRLDVAKQLIHRGASVSVSRGQINSTPLLAACQGACPSIALLLISHGADPHAATSAGVTPLMVAAWWGSTGCVRVLLQHDPDLLATDYAGHDGIYFAALRHHADCLELLLKAGADANRATVRGWTALMAAARNGCERCVRALLAHHADSSAATPAGWTALREAARHCHADIARLLLEAQAAVHPGSGPRWPAFETAVQTICPGVMRAMIESVHDIKAIRHHIKRAANEVDTQLQTTDLHSNVRSRLEQSRDLLESALNRVEGDG
ncbi:MAG: ankyrin repeat domain-containing protein [Phycisphaerales bacterium]|nr:ankyrin repeat domain-containing protein [Phycisphaerales bacterium]